MITSDISKDIEYVETLRTYNSNARYFKLNFEDKNNFKSFLLNQFLSALPPESRVLDLGSGVGTYALRIRDAGHQVTCLDNSQSLVDISRNRGLVTFMTDMRELNLKKELYEGIWAINSFTHLPKRYIEGLLYKTKDVLKDKGVFFMSVPEGSEEGLFEEEHLPGFKRYFSKYEKTELESILTPLFKFKQIFDEVDSDDEKLLNYLLFKR